MKKTCDSLSEMSAGLSTVADVARFLTISRSAVYNLMNSGRLRFVKLGRTRRIRTSDVLQFVEDHTIGQQEDAE